MARGKKARNFTHLICPTSQVIAKKKVAAEVRSVDNLDEVVFTGKSRNECAKWVNDQKTDSQYIKLFYLSCTHQEWVQNGSMIPALAVAKVVESKEEVPADIAGDFDNLQDIADLVGE